MKLRRKQTNGAVPLLARLQESVQVGLGVFLFCAVSILGFSVIAWLALLAMDPQHVPLQAAFEIARFTRIPWAINAGLAIFFGAVNWHSTEIGKEIGAQPCDISRYTRFPGTEKRPGAERDREVS